MEDNLITNRKLTETEALELLEELELNAPSSVQAVREQHAIRVKAAIEVQPGNICDRAAVVATGQTREIQSRGLSCVLDRPVLVGSVFHLSFAREQLDAAPSLGVCDKCIMLEETAFETHFKFAQSVDLTGLHDGQD